MCIPMVDSCQPMAETKQYCKAIILQLKMNKFEKNLNSYVKKPPIEPNKLAKKICTSYANVYVNIN